MSKNIFDKDKDLNLNNEDYNNEDYNDTNYEDDIIDDGYEQIAFNLDYESYNDLNNEDIEDETNEEDNVNNEKLDYNTVFYQEVIKLIDDSKKANKRKVFTAIIASSLATSLLTSFCFSTFSNKSNNAIESAQKIVIDDSNSKGTNVYKAVATKATPSVVGITTLSVNTNNIFSIPTESEGLGSGVIVHKDGYILTNSHVVDDGNATKVTVMFHDGKSVDGNVLWNDALLDLAIVKVDGQNNLSVADLADSSKVEVGDIAIAIGNPLGLEFNRSVTQGIISGLDRKIETEKGVMSGLFQTDASINPGNSGGPLLNSKGEVIGINTAKASGAEGLGFTIPINIAKPIIESVINDGTFEKVVLGIKGYDVASMKTFMGLELSVDKGVYIMEISPDTPAKTYGLHSGDIIVGIDNNTITSMNDLSKYLYEYTKGDSTVFKIVRDGLEKEVTVKF